MRTSALFTSLIAAQASALKILLNNDDGWSSANIRELYKALKNYGHDVLLVGPAVQQSGTGGTVVFTTEANLTGPAAFNSVPAGAPSFGTDPADSQLWYYNGTPAACTFFALDYVIPRVWNGTLPDLMVSGPNFGSNAGPFVYELSGTLGAAYSAIQRNIPSIALSAVNSTRRGWLNVTDSPFDTAVLAANTSAALVNQLISNVPAGQRLLPLGYGLNVNLPNLNESCTNPTYVQTRMTGGAAVDKAVQDPETGLFDWENTFEDGVNACINGDCSLPGETNVIKGCAIAVSVFTTDYDAPNCVGSAEVRHLLEPLVEYSQGASSASNATASTTASAGPVQQTVNAGAALRPSWAATMAIVAILAFLS